MMRQISPLPNDDSWDSTLALASEGYAFISNRCQRLRSDVFQTRLLLENVVCMQGKEAAELFYDEERFQRRGAAPKRALKTLFGQGGVQGMDGEAHRHRKEMFMSLMSSESIQNLVDNTAQQWDRYAEQWEERDRIALFDEVRELLCRAVCAWAGVPLPEAEVEQRTGDLGTMIDGSGAVGVRHWKARWARKRAEDWVGKLVEKVRTGELNAPEGSALQVVAEHRTQSGELLDRHTAAVEVLNLLRPTIDVARYITFCALALHDYPDYGRELQRDGEDFAELFVQEVRRFYPFFPFVAARIRKPFIWNGFHFSEGQRALLDLYGTNHDDRLWEEPEAFRPDRFRDWDEGAFNFIPQGGGDHYTDHRCPGEWITKALMKQALQVLTEEISYDVPEQDLQVPLSTMPALPNSHFVITNVQKHPT